MPIPWSVTLKQSHRASGAPCSEAQGGGAEGARKEPHRSEG